MIADFDRVAPIYELLETLAFGRSLQRARIAFLHLVRNCKRGLIVGEGTGRFLRKLTRLNPTMDIDCVDASEKMLRLAQQAIPSAAEGDVEGSRCETFKVTSAGSLDFARDDGKAGSPVSAREDVRWHSANIRDWNPPRTDYDLIVTHFFLDCFDESELPGVIEKLSSLAAPNARWLIADFAQPARGWRRVQAQLWLRAMYLFFRITTGLQTRVLIDPSPFLKAKNFVLLDEKFSRGGLIKSQIWGRA